MKFGLFAASVGPLASPAGAVAAATAAERQGFDSVWAIEHVVVPAGYESRYPYAADGKLPAGEVMAFADPLIWLAHVAATTTTLKLATGIVILPQRNPLVLAKAAATLAVLSQDRFTLGVGVGWLEEEFTALGVPFADRGRRTNEYIDVMRRAWAGDTDGFSGEFVSHGPLYCEPTPPAGRVPILVGGHSPAACRRAGQLGDGFYPGCASFEDIKIAVDAMRNAAVEAHRDPATIEVTVGAPFSAAGYDVDEIRRLADIGVDRVTVLPPSFEAADIEDRLAEYRTDVIERVNT